LQKLYFFERIKTALHCIKTIKRYQHAYRNVSDTFLHAFLVFGSISRHWHCTKNNIHCCQTLVPPLWTSSKGPCIISLWATKSLYFHSKTWSYTDRLGLHFQTANHCKFWIKTYCTYLSTLN